MRNILFAAMTLGLFLVFTTAAEAGLVVNGDFETGDLTGWSLIQAIPVDTSFFYVGAPPTGGNAAHFGAIGSDYDSISQDIATTAGHSYTFAFLLAHDLDEPLNDFTASWNGSPVLTFHNDLGPFDFTSYSFAVTAAGESTPITFSGRDVEGFYDLDDVSVTDATVPEPSTLTMFLGLGGIGLAGCWWRRKRIAA